jgi:VCBS repeat-containing protein
MPISVTNDIFAVSESDVELASASNRVLLGNVLTSGTPDSDSDGDTLTVSAIANWQLNERDLELDVRNVTTPQPNQVRVWTADGVALVEVAADGWVTMWSESGDAFKGLGVGETCSITFTYTVSDGNGETASAVGTITISGTNDGPIAQDDAVTINEDSGISAGAPGVLVLSRDDGGYANMTAMLVDGPQHAQAFTLNPDGSFTYLPVANYHGTDSFTFKIRDAQGLESNVATYTIGVTSINDTPFALPDNGNADAAFQMRQDEPSKAFNVLANDRLDADGPNSVTFDSSNVRVSDNPYGITVDDLAISVDATNRIVVELRGGEWNEIPEGVSVFITVPYALHGDLPSDVSNANLIVKVGGVGNHAPVLDPISAPAAIDEAADASPQTISLAGQLAVTDADLGQPLTAEVIGLPSVTLDGVFFPATAAMSGLIAAGVLTFEAGSATNGGTQAIGWHYNATAADLDFLAAGQDLAITFTVRVNDAAADSNNQTLTIHITGTNDAPVVGSLDGNTVAFTEGGAPLQIDQGNNATVFDVDNPHLSSGTLTVAITGNGVPTEDVLSIANAGGITVVGDVISFNGTVIASLSGGTGGAPLVIDPDPAANLAAMQALVRALRYQDTNTDNPDTHSRTVTVTLADGDGGSSVSNVTVNVIGVNDAPVISGLDNAIVAENQSGVLLDSFTVSDVDTASGLSFWVLNGATVDGRFEVRAAAGTTYGTPGTYQVWLVSPLDYEAENSDGNPTITRSIVVNDGATTDYLATTPITVTVTDVFENLAPVLRPAYAQSFTFESGLEGWQTTAGGSRQIIDGDYAVRLDTSGKVTASAVASFLGLAQGALSQLDPGQEVSGAAQQMQLSLIAGQTVTFAWNFGTLDDGALLPDYNDVGFFTVSGGANPATVQLLSSIAALDGAATGGWHTFTYTATATGTFTLGFGVMNVDDEDPSYGSWLYVDDIVVTGQSLVSITEDAGAPSGAVGTLVSQIVDLPGDGGRDNVMDANPGSVTGIALTGTNSAHGTWWYSLDNGLHWQQVGVVSDTKALLLAADARVYFQPAANFNGTVDAAISFRAWDQTSGDAGSKTDVGLNGGSTAYSAVTATASLTVLPVNDPPVAMPDTATTNEDTPLAVTAANGVLANDTDADIGDTRSVIAGDFTTEHGGSIHFSANGSYKYTPPASFKGIDIATYTVMDGAGATDVGTLTITVSAVNHAPSGTDATITVNGSAAYVFKTADFGFSDVDGNAFAALKIAGLPAKGALYYDADGGDASNAVAAASGQTISADAIAAGKLFYQPATGAGGASYASFKFQVQDDGGTAPGQDLDPIANTLTINYNSSPHLLFQANPQVGSIMENITTLRTERGILNIIDNDGLGTNNLVFSGADRDLFDISYISGTYAIYFKAGVTPDYETKSSYTLTVTLDDPAIGAGPEDSIDIVVPVANMDEPAIALSNTIMMDEDSVRVLTAADFPYRDPEGQNTPLAGLDVLGASHGKLFYNNSVVDGSTFSVMPLSKADLDAGKLRFVPDKDAYGTGYATVTFYVVDNLGLGTPATLTFDVTPVNDAPQWSGAVVSVDYTENSTTVLASNIAVLDAELAALNGGLGDYSGASLTLSRSTGAAAEDVFGFDTTAASFTLTGAVLQDLGSHTFATFATGNGVLTITFATVTGVPTSALVQDVLHHITYTNVRDDLANQTLSFTWSLDDGNAGAQGSGGALTGSATTSLHLQAVDDAPVNAVPDAQRVAAGAALVFSVAGGNAISIADADAGSQALRVTLTVAHGTLTLGSSAGLAGVSGDGTGVVVLTGSLSALNAALDGLTYRAPSSYDGADQLSVLTNDLGHSGAGGPQTAQETLDITVDRVNQPPVVTSPSWHYDAVEQLALDLKGTGLSVSDDGSGIETLTLSVDFGKLSAAAGDSGTTIDSGNGTSSLTISGTIAALNAFLGAGGTSALSYLADGDAPPASAILSLSINDQDPLGAKSASTTTTIAIAPVNDPPALAIAASAAYTEGGAPVMLDPALMLVDPDGGPGYSATVQIISGYVDGDTIAGVGHFDAATQTFTTSLAPNATLAALQAVLRDLTFSSTSQNPGDLRKLAWTVSDGSGSDATVMTTTLINVTAVDNAPNVPGPVTLAPIAENTTRLITQAELLAGVTDPDGPFQAINLAIAGGAGTLHDNHDGTWTYVPAVNDDTSVSFSYLVSDGIAAPVANSATLDITAVNTAPVNTVPGAQDIDANTAAAIAGLAISDVDAASGMMTTTLSVASGTLTVSSAGGAAVTGSGTATVTLSGTLAQINTTLGATHNVVYQGAHDFFGNDTLTISTNDNGNTGAGGPLSDTDQVTIHLNTHLTGTPGNDSLTALPGNARIDALTGNDTISFNFRLVDAKVTYSGNQVIVDGPSGSHTVLTGFEKYVFTDGTVDNNDGDPLVDDLFYYSRNHDVWNAHVDADAHYHQSGWREGRDPDAFFSTSTYLSLNPAVKAAGLDPLLQFDQTGWKQGYDPSIFFDASAYQAANPDVRAAGVDPLAHFLANGAQEGRTPFAPATLVASNGFDYVYYLQHNPDVAAAHVDPFLHFETVGWKEGRNPNAYFDVSGYLSHYRDVAAAGVNPLDHYNQSGWKEGRDPAPSFDTTDYLSHYPDVANAHINPLTHFLQYGLSEGRSPFADGVWG